MKRLLKQPIAYLTLAFISGISVGCSVMGGADTGKTASTTQVQTTKTESRTEPSPSNSFPQGISESDPNYIAQVVQQAGPAVVRIDSTRTIERPALQDPLFDRFFGNQAPPQQQIQRGTGSGFITTPDGVILTNAHVVEKADRVFVVLKDGRRIEGQVVGSDPVTDVAVVKVNEKELPTLKLGNSDNLLPGQAAIAIGNPLGLSNTVTQGIISATERSAADVGVPAERIDFIQTDAAINPGNSGGPLLNARGEVIGMNTAIIQGAQGIGFAIPINIAQRVAEQIVTKGRADHPYVGIQMAELDPELRAQINQSDLGFTVNRDTGVVILRVARNSPAARAELRPGDVIERIGDVSIQNAQQVQQQIEANGLGRPLQMTVNRNGRSETIAIQPVQLPTEEQT